MLWPVRDRKITNHKVAKGQGAGEARYKCVGYDVIGRRTSALVPEYEEKTSGKDADWPQHHQGTPNNAMEEPDSSFVFGREEIGGQILVNYHANQYHPEIAMDIQNY